MFCTKCGVGLEERDNFCYQCGTTTGKSPVPGPRKLLTRKTIDKKIAGVCAGFAEYIDADPVVVRLLWVLLSLGLPPAGILGYIIAWIVIPKETVVLATAPVGAGPAAPQQA